MKRLSFALLALVTGLGWLATQAAAVAADAVLVEFSSPHCGPCRAMQPVLAELERGGVPIRHVDLAIEPHLAARYGVRQTPTFVVVSGGQEVTRLIGMQSAEQLRAALAIDLSGPLVPTGSQWVSSPAGETPQTSLSSIAPAAPPTGFQPPSQEPMPSATVADAVERAQAATVRLRVHDGTGHGVGTGTIIDTHGDEALVLTCGHLFRETKGQGKIEVDLFVGGQTRTVAGQVIDYDADQRDIALVAIRPGFPVHPVALITSGEKVQAGEAVFSFGCDRGADPSRRDTRVTGVNKYNQHLGLSNLEIAGAPIDGRSGGGLFDHRGRLIGVCNAADYQGDVGIYTGPGSVHWQLDRVNLANLYRPPSGGNPGRPAEERLASLSGETFPDLSPAQPANLNPAQPTDLTPATPTGDQEVIVIIRNRDRPEAGSRMIELDRPSEELIRMLESQARR